MKDALKKPGAQLADKRLDTHLSVVNKKVNK
jgi:hypothetical protein